MNIKRCLKPKSNFSSLFGLRSFSQVNFPDRMIDYFLKPGHYTFVDKTKLIEKVLENNNTEIIYRPQNFGKSFNLNVLRYFLSSNRLIDERVDKDQKLEFFKNTDIFKNETFVRDHYSRYPVIFLNFKELDQNNFSDNLEKFKLLINGQFEQVFQYEEASSLLSVDKKFIDNFFTNFHNYSTTQLLNVTRELSKILLKITKQNPFILIDDYDFPLSNAYRYGFSDDMLGFEEMFFNNLLKNNNYINKTLITGETRLEHDRLFSGLNNIITYGLGKDTVYTESFGITQSELAKYVPDINIAKKYFGGFNVNGNELYDYVSMSNLNKFNIDQHENIGQVFNINHISNNLNLKSLSKMIIDETSANYIDGVKTLANLSEQCDKLINQGSNFEFQPIQFKALNSIQYSNAHNTDVFLNHLYSQGLITRNGQVTNIYAANILKKSFIDFEGNLKKGEFNIKLAYIYYRYLCKGKLLEYMNQLVKLFSEHNKLNTDKKSKDSVNLSFRTEKDLENYLVDVMTIELNNDNGNHDIQILSIEDHEEAPKSQSWQALKNFTLITYEKKHFAIFVKASKQRRSKKSEEALNIENSKLSIKEAYNNNPDEESDTKLPSNKQKGSSSSAEELRKINEKTISAINKEEAIDFALKVSSEFKTIYFLSVANNLKQFEYSLDQIDVTRE